MNSKYLITMSAILLGLSLTSTVAIGESDATRGEAQVDALLKALAQSDADAFRQHLTEDFADYATDDVVLGVAVQIKDRLQSGHREVYLGALQQGGDSVHLWGVKFSDGEDDALVRIVLDGSKVSGFIITPPFQ